MAKIYKQEVTLPTRGIIYDDIPGKVVLRNITSKEEKIVYSQNQQNFMYDLVEECVIEPKDLSTEDLVLADTFFLLIQLRMHTYGSVYNVEHNCPYCDHPNTWKVDFNDFPVYELEDDFTEPIVFELPVSGDEIGVELLRGRDILDVDKEVQKQIRTFPNMKGDPSMEIRMQKYIKMINGKEVNPGEAKKYVDNGLHGKDSAYFWHRINKLELGYDPTVRRKCKNVRCGRMNEFVIPMTPEFFRPSFDD